MIGNEIRKLRKDKGLSLATVADELGTSVQFVSNLERGVTRLPVGRMVDLARILGLSAEQMTTLCVREYQEEISLYFKGETK